LLNTKQRLREAHLKLTLRQQITQFAHVLQQELFPVLQDELGELTRPAKRLVATLEMIPLDRFVPSSRGWIGRPSKDRLAIAKAFVAKAVYGFSLTRQLLDALASDTQLRRICGWSEPWQVPHESTFSRAFEEFARMELPQFVHEALIRETQQDRLIGHIARDSTAIEARERYPETPAQAAQKEAEKPARRRGRKQGTGGPHKRYKGGKRPYVPQGDTRLARQREMKLPEMLADLPRQCDLGGKKDSHGNDHYWRGYKLHWDVADGQIPISVVLTSASVHDSQVAIPLATMSTQRVDYCYELMDSAYEAYHIVEQSRSLGHVPIVDPKAPGGPKSQAKDIPQAKPKRELTWAEQERYQERTMVERANARLKDEFGGRNVRVRGAMKVMAHLMFGILALTADQLLRMVVKRV
jgi:Transposase DDE domain/Transposase domain (DUF772)